MAELSNTSIFKLGLIEKNRKEQMELQTIVRSYRESLNHLFFRYPFDLDRIDIEAVRNLTNNLTICLERYRKLKAEIDEYQG